MSRPSGRISGYRLATSRPPPSYKLATGWLQPGYITKAQKLATWTNAPLVQVRPRGGREAARRPRSQNSGELSQEVEPSESNAADMGVREPVDRLLACRRHPSSRAQDGPPLTLSPASLPRTPPFLFPVSPSGRFFWKLLFSISCSRGWRRLSDHGLSNSASARPADRARRTPCSSTSKLSRLSGTMQHMIKAIRPGYR
jgi:hypothetical protein